MILVRFQVDCAKVAETTNMAQRAFLEPFDKDDDDDHDDDDDDEDDDDDDDHNDDDDEG